jgi:plasmid segregation protein ParM
MNNNRFIVMGIDHGNGYFKGYSDDVKGLVFPSGLLTKDSALREDSAGLGGETIHEYESSLYTGERYVWGPAIDRAKGRYLSTYTNEDRYTQKHYKILSQFGMASLIRSAEGAYDVFLVTGCPPREKGTRREQEIVDLFKGTHIVQINDTDKIINVKECKVLPQPLGSILDLYIDEKGTIVRDEIGTSYIGIVDIGSGTTDFDGIDSLRAIPEDRLTIPIGVHEIYQRLADYINAQSPDANATAKNVELQFHSDAFQVSKRLVIPIKEMKEKIVRETAEYLINELQIRWRHRSKFDMVILTGGGVKILEPWFRAFIKDIHIVEDYQLSNARGFYKLGLLLAGEYKKEAAQPNLQAVRS